MNTFAINQYGVIVKDEYGNSTMIRKGSPVYREAKNAVLCADWDEFYDLADLDEGYAGVAEDDSVDFEVEDEFVHASPSIADKVAEIKGLLADGLIDAEDLGIETAGHEHDLSQWSGSPIFYPTREMAEAQANRWSMFWEYHDFGGDAPNGYRHATVPRLSMAPTAPEGYDWVCLPRTKTGL